MQDKTLTVAQALQILPHAAARFLEITEEQELFEFVAEAVSSLAPEAFVIACSPGVAGANMTVRAAAGLGEHHRLVSEAFGEELVGFTLPILPDSFNSQEGGKLVKLYDKLTDIITGAIPGPVLTALTDSRLSREVYAASFSRSGLLYGGVWILPAKGAPFENTDVIETLIKMAAAALQRLSSSRRLAVLSRIGQIVTSSLELPEVMRRVIQEAHTFMGVGMISILLQEEADSLTFVAVSEGSDPNLVGKRIPAGAGAAGAVMRTGQPVSITQEAQQSLIFRAVDASIGYQTRSLLAVPLLWDGCVIGVVEAVDNRLGAFTEDDLHTLEGVSSWAAIAIANARQYATIQQKLHESDAFAEIGRSLMGMLDLERVLQMIAEWARSLIPNVRRSVIHLLNEQEQILKIAAATGMDGLEGPFFTLHTGEGVAGKVMAEGRTIYIADISTDSLYVRLGAVNPAGSLLVAPIQIRGRSLGTISVSSSKPGAFSQDHDRLLTGLGGQAALAIGAARVYEAERESRLLAETLLQQEKSTRAQLVQGEKLAALGRIVASVAHELNNPLQAIQNAIFLVLREDDIHPQNREDLQMALSEAGRMADLISRLRETYRPAAGEEFKVASLNNLASEIGRLLATHMRHENIEFCFHPDPALPPIPMIQDQIRQVILNLALNAIEAMHAGGKLTLSTCSQPETGGVIISVSDTGEGISGELLPNIFDPFFTTKQGGTGLGLAISYDIIQRHQGSISVTSQPGEGSNFQVWLPTRASRGPDSGRKRAGPDHSGRGRP